MFYPLSPQFGLNRTQILLKEIISAFSFLEAKYGFRLVSTQGIVRYESASVFVNIYYNIPPYEMEIEIGLLKDSSELQRNFTLAQLVRLTDPKSPSGFPYLSATSLEEIHPVVKRLADLFLIHAEKLLYGKPQVFDEFAERVKNQKKEQNIELQLNKIRSQAESAWQDKDYSKVVALYESIRRFLTITEEKRLEYSKKKMHA